MSESETATPGPEPDNSDGQAAPAPGLEESIRQIGSAGRDTLDAAGHTVRSLRRLVSADFALARSAFGRALAWSGVAIVFGASAWLLLAATLVALLQYIGLSLFTSLLVPTLASLAMAGYAVWRVSYFFHHTGMHATRRQLSRLGLFDEPAADDAEAEVELPGDGTP